MATDVEDAAMFRWLEKQARKTDFDGGWWGVWDIRGIPAYNDSGSKPFNHKTFRRAVKAAIKAENKGQHHGND